MAILCAQPINYSPCRRFFAAGNLMLALCLGGLVSANGQDPNVPVPSRPGTVVTIQGRVSLSNGRPAAGVLVKLTTRGGVPRQTFTNDQGRYEFNQMEEGGYVLTASSLADPGLTSDAVQTDTSNTATGTLNVSLTLHEPSETNKKPKPSVIRVGESTQKIPKEARKAFDRGLKFKANNESGKALESFGRAIELYPEYLQALVERGDLYVLQRQLSEATADFDRALKIDDHYGPALRGAGYCKLEKRQFAQAVDDFERSILAQPENASTYLLLGIANLELDRREPAKQALEKALTFTSQPMSRAHIYLANLYALEHQYREAADELRKYLDAEPVAADVKSMQEVEARWRARAAAH
jgi:Tfp pilus assembly protein PilF